jgi:hypothetical protein
MRVGDNHFDRQFMISTLRKISPATRNRCFRVLAEDSGHSSFKTLCGMELALIWIWKITPALIDTFLEERGRLMKEEAVMVAFTDKLKGLL